MDTPARASVATLAKRREQILRQIESDTAVIVGLETEVAGYRAHIEAGKVAAADIVEAIITLTGAK